MALLNVLFSLWQPGLVAAAGRMISLFTGLPLDGLGIIWVAVRFRARVLQVALGRGGGGGGGWGILNCSGVLEIWTRSSVPSCPSSLKPQAIKPPCAPRPLLPFNISTCSEVALFDECVPQLHMSALHKLNNRGGSRRACCS